MLLVLRTPYRATERQFSQRDSLYRQTHAQTHLPQDLVHCHELNVRHDARFDRDRREHGADGRLCHIRVLVQAEDHVRERLRLLPHKRETERERVSTRV